MVPKGIHGCECLEWRQVGGPEQGASDAAVTVSEVAKQYGALVGGLVEGQESTSVKMVFMSQD